MRAFFAKAGGYAASTVALAVATVLTIPAVIGGGGQAAWEMYVLAQASGAILAVLSSFGWTVMGPASVANEDAAFRWHAYRISFIARLIVFMPFAAILLAVSSSVGAGDVAGLLICVAVGLNGLSAAWVFIGAGKPLALLWFDTIPRVVGIVIGCLLILSTGSLLAFSVAQLIGAAGAVSMSAIALRREAARPDRSSVTIRELRSGYRRHFSGAIATAVSLVYLSLPVLAVGAMLPSALAQFGLVDRLHKLASAGLQPVSQFNQGWVPRGAESLLHTRIRRAIKLNSLAGAFIALAVLLGAPVAASILSLGTIHVGFDYSVPLALVIFATFLSQCTGMACLSALKLTRAIAVSASLGAVVVVIGLFLLIPWLGGPGATWAIAAAELTVVAAQLLVLRAHLRVPTMTH